MGTVFSISVPNYSPDPQVIERITQWWRWVDATFSPFRADSEVSRHNRSDLRASQLSAEVAEVIELCRAANDATAGYFDAWTSGGFDPCGLVKGWSVEIASDMLKMAGYANHCINGGGDIRCTGQPEQRRPWHVGIADPLRPGDLAAAIAVGEGAVGTSGGAERGHHVLDPHTRRSSTELASVTVVGPNVTWVDAFATAAFAMGREAEEWLCGLRGHEGLLVYADGRRWATPGLLWYGS
jgi:thiamine biosynthesis lipoprotein